MAEQCVVTLTLIKGQGWVRGGIAMHPIGERCARQCRSVTCRVGDAPAEVAELIEWALSEHQSAPSLFDV
jgi:hypothetical protein